MGVDAEIYFSSKDPYPEFERVFPGDFTDYPLPGNVSVDVPVSAGRQLGDV